MPGIGHGISVGENSSKTNLALGRFWVYLLVTEATARHKGRPLAIILDGEIVAVQTVRQALASEMVFSGDFSEADAARIVAGLNKW